MSGRAARIWLALGGVVAASCNFDSSSTGNGGGDGRDSGPDTIDATVASDDGSMPDAAGGPDADVSPLDCATACDGIGTCEGEVCTITCGDDSCDDRVDCPAGVPCRVRCSEPGACGGGIRCGGATSCTVECSANDSCAGAIECGDDLPCTVTCSAQNTCVSGVQCSASCACSVACDGPSSCDTDATCPEGCDAGKGCTATRDGCHTCER
jgi:hypothetical protein